MKIDRTLLLNQSSLLMTMCSELISGRVVTITPDDTTTFNLLNGLALLCNSILDEDEYEFDEYNMYDDYEDEWDDEDEDEWDDFDDDDIGQLLR